MKTYRQREKQGTKVADTGKGPDEAKIKVCFYTLPPINIVNLCFHNCDRFPGPENLGKNAQQRIIADYKNLESYDRLILQCCFSLCVCVNSLSLSQ